MKWILFDLDGTLLDTTPLIRASFSHVLQTLNMKPDGLQHIVWGRPLREVLAKMCAGMENEAFQTYQEFYRENRHMVDVFPGILQTLRQLKQTGVVMAVVTNKSSRPAREDLSRHHLEEYFSCFFGREDTIHPKPHPELVLRALSALSACPEETVMVGDTAWDMMAGRGAGVKTGAAMWGPDPEGLSAFGPTDYRFCAPQDIPGALGLEQED